MLLDGAFELGRAADQLHRSLGVVLRRDPAGKDQAVDLDVGGEPLLAARALVLSALQEGVKEIVSGVQVVMRDGIARRMLQGRVGRAPVPLDDAWPLTQAHEDVRWHVQRVRHLRRDLAVALDDVRRPVGAAGGVVGVDRVVDRAGMVGHLLIDAAQHDLGLIVKRCPVLGHRRQRQTRERIQRRRVGLLRVGAVGGLHCVGPTFDPGPPVGRLGLAEEGFCRRHEMTLPLGRGLHRLGILDLAPAQHQVIGARTGGPERLEQRGGDAPDAPWRIRDRS
jgi:hypothetical protein